MKTQKEEDRLKICAVCGDIAYAKNFGAFSCKSCKPFFRRSAFKNETLKCNNQNNCRINRNTRKNCRKCRLNKCFAVGMKKELILDDVEKHFRRTLVEENRKKRQKSEEVRHVFNEITLFSESSVSMNSIETIDFSDDIQLRSESISIYCSQIPSIDQNFEKDIIEDQISEIEAFLTITELMQKSVDSYKETIDFVSQSYAIARPITNYQTNYTQLEEYKFMELFQAFRPLLYELEDLNKYFEIISINTLLELPHSNNIFYEREIKNLIKAMRNMSVFEDICENDRIALIKCSSIDILIMRSILCYDFDNEAWIIEVDEERAYLLRLDILKAVKSDAYIIYKNNLNAINKECDSDTVILDLLTAIALFNPNRPNLINREFVRVQQHVYLYLLQRYLTFKYRTKYESEYKSEKLLNTLINARILGELEKKYFVEDYQEQYSPLVKEAFDL